MTGLRVFRKPHHKFYTSPITPPTLMFVSCKGSKRERLWDGGFFGLVPDPTAGPSTEGHGLVDRLFP